MNVNEILGKNTVKYFLLGGAGLLAFRGLIAFQANHPEYAEMLENSIRQFVKKYVQERRDAYEDEAA